MANVDDTTGAEHPGFLQKIKDKLHIGHHQKDKEVAPATSPKTTDRAVASNSSSTAVDAPAASPPVKEEPAIAKPSPPVEHEPHHPTPDLNKVVGHESEHHGGTPTLPDQDIPDEATKETDTSDAQGGEFFDSEEVFSKPKEAEHHGGVPTFLVSLPEQDLPDEGTKEHLHHVTAGQASEGTQHSSDKGLDPEEVFSNAQQGEHHGGVPTFLVSLPDQDLPDEGTKEHLHHVTAGQASEGAQHSSDKGLDPEEVFSNAQQGEHHGGVPTFLVALPDEEIPGEVNKEVSSDVAGNDVDDSGVKQEFDSEEVFNKAQQGEHHEGVPTFLVALPDQDLPGDEAKEKLHHVSVGRTEDA